jgi:hypothetical protein
MVQPLPPTGSDQEWIGSLAPAPVADQLVVSELTRHPAMMPALLRVGSAGRRRLAFARARR